MKGGLQDNGVGEGEKQGRWRESDERMGGRLRDGLAEDSIREGEERGRWREQWWNGRRIEGWIAWVRCWTMALEVTKEIEREGEEKVEGRGQQAEHCVRIHACVRVIDLTAP